MVFFRSICISLRRLLRGREVAETSLLALYSYTSAPRSLSGDIFGKDYPPESMHVFTSFIAGILPDCSQSQIFNSIVGSIAINMVYIVLVRPYGVDIEPRQSVFWVNGMVDMDRPIPRSLECTGALPSPAPSIRYFCEKVPSIWIIRKPPQEFGMRDYNPDCFFGRIFSHECDSYNTSEFCQ